MKIQLSNERMQISFRLSQCYLDMCRRIGFTVMRSYCPRSFTSVENTSHNKHRFKDVINVKKCSRVSINSDGNAEMKIMLQLIDASG